MISEIRGYRNNNPGNIRKGDSWKGLSDKQTDPAFCQFTSPEYGVRALAILLKNYQKKYNLRTPQQIIARYAPSNENDTSAYVAHVCGLMKVDPEFSLDLGNTYILRGLISAIITHELGINPYSDTLIQKGIDLA